MLLALGLLLGLMACQEKMEQPILSDEKIARIMADIYVADAATNGLVGFPKDSLSRIYAQQVLDVHSISLDAYEEDLRRLAQDPDRLQRVAGQAKALLEVPKEEKK